MNDFAELKPEYYSLGVQLKVPVDIIEEIKSDTGDRLAKIFHHWLHNNQEDLWFGQLHTALQRMNKINLAIIVQQKYMNKFTEGMYMAYLIISIGGRHTMSIVNMVLLMFNNQIKGMNF